VVGDAGESWFGEVGLTPDNRLKQNKMFSPLDSQPWISGKSRGGMPSRLGAQPGMGSTGHECTTGLGEAPLASVPFALKTLQFAAVELARRELFRHFANPLVFEQLPDSGKGTWFVGAGFRHESS
jgi:hypothetical protein